MDQLKQQYSQGIEGVTILDIKKWSLLKPFWLASPVFPEE